MSWAQVDLDAIAGDLQALGLEESSIKRLLEVMKLRDIDGVEGVLGKDSKAVEQVKVEKDSEFQPKDPRSQFCPRTGRHTTKIVYDSQRRSTEHMPFILLATA